MARFDLSDEEWTFIAPLLPVDGLNRSAGKTEPFSTASFTFFEPVRHGGTCREDMALLPRSIIVMSSGENVLDAQAAAGKVKFTPL
uniref:hypothetical protein n=1 Tax=Thalassospira sp. SN3W TaxID=3035476 RepID=UPI004054D8FE